MVRISFAVAVIALAITPVLLVAAMVVNGPTPLLWALWPIWALTVAGAALIGRAVAKRRP